MRRRAGGDYNHNPSNHSYNGSAATSRCADDDNNDAHGRRLLIAEAGRGCVCCRHARAGHPRISKAALDSNGHKPVATVKNGCSGFLSGRFYALGFLFLRLTNYGRDRLKLFAIAEIH